MRDSEGRNPLHFAAYFGHQEEARYLLKRYSPNAKRGDRDGRLPIHLAAFQGHVDIISLLLQDFRDAEELLDMDGNNILHVAAMRGKYNVIKFFLKNPRFNYLINMRDHSGNTPLHWASMLFHPKIVITLTWDKRVDVMAVNGHSMTALDVSERNMPRDPQFRVRLTWAALKAASIPRRGLKKAFYRKWADMRSASGEASHRKWADNKYSDMGNSMERVNTLLVVATLVATVTFAAGFTMPGGYNSSDSEAETGMATMLRDKGFHMFLFCDTIAMYSSIIAATALIWAYLNDLTLAIKALTLAVPLLGIALGTMSMAFAAGVFVVVTKLPWLSTTILAMGISFLAFLLLLLLPLCTSFTSTNRILRRLSYYPFLLLVLVTGDE